MWPFITHILFTMVDSFIEGDCEAIDSFHDNFFVEKKIVFESTVGDKKERLLGFRKQRMYENHRMREAGS